MDTDTPILPDSPKIGLILAGGGARAAYQVGVLKAIAQMLPEGCPNPFHIICGTSAGAINGAVLAINATRFHEGMRRLAVVWGRFHVDQVFRADARGVLGSGLHWLTALALGGLGRHNPRALLDRSPLQRLLSETLPLADIQHSIDAGALHAFAVTASGYGSGQSVTFYQGNADLEPWARARRVGVRAPITLDHLMASSAIPLIFEAVHINREWFGDGSMRQTAPISPALHLGADRVLVIGVRQESEDVCVAPLQLRYPSLAHIGGHVLNSIFLDSLEADLERLRRINRTLGLIPPQRRREAGLTLRPIEVLNIAPSQDLTRLAERHAHHLPRPVRYLLRGVGALNRNGSSLVSYLLFEEAYCRELMDLGYSDTMDQRESVLAFLRPGGVAVDGSARAAVMRVEEGVSA